MNKILRNQFSFLVIILSTTACNESSVLLYDNYDSPNSCIINETGYAGLSSSASDWTLGERRIAEFIFEDCMKLF
jgi:hypothetical protein